MDDGLPAYADCGSCGGTRLHDPVEFEATSWMRCFDCGEPAVLWPDYKARALGIATSNLSNRFRDRRRSRGRR